MFNFWASQFVLLPAAYQYAMITIFGLLIGSFITVVVHRVPIMLERTQAFIPTAALGNLSAKPDLANAANVKLKDSYHLWWPRSHCPSCHTKLGISENLPLLSYIKLRGRCAACQIPISWRYPALELLSACAACSVFWRFGANWQAVAAFGLIATLLALAFIDAKTHLLPDLLTLPLMWAGLLLNLNATFAPLPEAVLGAVAGYLSLWLIYWLFRAIRGVEGIGYGDFKLCAALGAWLGWSALPQIMLIASLTGLLFGFTALLKGRLKQRQLPFGPFLAIAAISTLFCGTFFY